MRPLRRPLQPWLDQTHTPEDVSERIKTGLRDELAGGTVTGFRPEVVESEVWFVQTFGSWIARRP